MPRRMLFRDETERFLQSVQDRGAQTVKPAVSDADADEWHRTQAARQALDRARNNYYLTHDSGSPLFPGDTEIEPL